MKEDSLYWNVYRQLEKDFLSIAEMLHIDDKQINVYSMRIADLLLRTVVEIEALSKKLYFDNGGDKADNQDLYYDTDCLALLEEKWAISKRKVQVIGTDLYLNNKENLVLTPLHKSFKRGTSGADWAKAYQAIKHNRVKSLEKGTIKNLMRAMAALFLLNIYNSQKVLKLGAISNVNDVDVSQGSSLFAIYVHPLNGISFDDKYDKLFNFTDYTYLIKITDDSYVEAIGKNRQLGNLVRQRAIDKVKHNSISGRIDLNEFYNVYLQTSIEYARENPNAIQQAIAGLRFEAVLNINQDKVYNIDTK